MVNPDGITNSYDAFGNVSVSGNTEIQNPYTYNAEYIDASTGNQYLRARYYDLEEGIFLTQDSYLGSLLEPLSQNLYTYAENNPVNYSDPSGHGILSKIKSAAKKVATTVKNTYNKAKTWVKNTYNKAKNWVSNTYQNAKKALTNVISVVAHQKKTNPENLHQGEGIQVEEVTLETENIHHPAEEAVKVIFIGHRPMNGRKALDSPGITGLVQK